MAGSVVESASGADWQIDARLAHARRLVMEYGWNATAYQIVNPGISLWFSDGDDAVIGYVERRRTRVVAGGPVCAAARVTEVVSEFERQCTAEHFHVCYFGAEERVETAVHRSATHAMVLLGAQPSWNPASWAGIIAGKASLRAQLNRSRNKGVVVSPMAPAEARGNSELQRVLREWLATRGLPPMHFLVEPETLDRLYDRRVFVARSRAGQIVAFLVASPAPARGGWLIEQFVRGRTAPNGTVELLLDAAMRAFAAEGYRYVTLGLAPLSRYALPAEVNPTWLRWALKWVRAHGRRFYNFEGLDNFKAKFQPERWEPVYAIVNDPVFTPRALYAIAAAFSDGSPIWTIARAFWRAARTELRWLRRRVANRRVR